MNCQNKTMMTKQVLRKEFLQKRMLLDEAGQQQRIIKMVIPFTEIPISKAVFVLSYMAIATKNEVVATAFEKAIIHHHPECRLCYPKTDTTHHSMEAIEFTKGHSLNFNKWGIAEPEVGKTIAPQMIDLILVPLLCFDKQGYRVGYGKGFYDRFMARCRPDVVTIGLSFFEPVGSIEDVDEYDVPLQFCVTPERLYHF